MKSRNLILSALLALCVAVETPATAPARECDKPFADVFEAASPSVVMVTAVAVDPFRIRDRVQPRVGSGFVIEPGDLIVTNSHVVYGASTLIVQSSEGDEIPVHLAGADPVLDLAVLKVEEGRHLRPLRLAGSDGLRVGDPVMAVGNSLGLGQTATVGVVSGLNRVLPFSTMSYLLPFIQTDAAINPGNSGGPLMNRCGEAVGVTTLMLRQARGAGFAVPARIVEQVVPELIEHGRIIRPWHGIYGRTIEPYLAMILRLPPIHGFLVETIEPGSPAEKIGLKGGVLPVNIAGETFLLGGDIITRVNGTALTDMATVLGVVNGFKVGQTVKIEFVRAGEGLMSAEVVLPERPVLPGDLRFGSGER
jgi:S1-C subfamily serine protease